MDSSAPEAGPSKMTAARAYDPNDMHLDDDNQGRGHDADAYTYAHAQDDDTDAESDSESDSELDADADASAATLIMPPPPNIYKRFTKRNLELWAILDEQRHSWAQDDVARDDDDDDGHTTTKTTMADRHASTDSAAAEASNAKHRLAQWERAWCDAPPAKRKKWQSQALLLHHDRRSKRGTRGRQGDGEHGDGKIEDEVEETAEVASDEPRPPRPRPPPPPPPPHFDVLLELDPPRVDWIEEDGSYLCFGERWPIPTVYPNLRQMGVTQLFPDGPIDRREVLLSLLRTYLLTHHRLVSLLRRPPREYVARVPVPPSADAPAPGGAEEAATPMVEVVRTEAQDAWERLDTLVRNMQFVVNECRPMQARQGLVEAMRAQLDRRRRQTQSLRRECAQIRQRLAELDADADAEHHHHHDVGGTGDEAGDARKAAVPA